MVCDGCNYFSFWAIFGPFTAQKSKFLKNEKKAGDIIILHMCTKYYDQMMYGSLDMVRNGWMDGQTKKVTYGSGCPT